jgi:hypothetical protein
MIEWLLPEVVEGNDDVMMTKKTIGKEEETTLFPPKLLQGDKMISHPSWTQPYHYGTFKNW